MRSDDLYSTTVAPPVAIGSEIKVGYSPVLIRCAILASLFALAAILQFVSGVFGAEFSGYPDEPAHYVTSLMIREYVTGPHPLSPLKFAEEYYHHYPKVAFGHWPPVFYVVQAFWMLIFSASRTSVRLEIAFTTALVAFSFWHEARRWFGNLAALLAAALLVCIPLVQRSTDEEMAEMLLVLFCFWSTVYFGRFLESGKRSDSLWFGVYFSLAVLTKGSGWLLAIVPAIALVLTRQIRHLLAPAFWAGIALIAVFCLPWQLITLHSAEQGWTGGSTPSIGYTLDALVQFSGMLVSVVGPVLSILIAIGIFTRVLVPMFAKSVDPVPAVMFALIVADWTFHSLVPAGVEDRKMIMAVPPLIYFLFAGGLWLADRIKLGRLAAWSRVSVAAIGTIVFATEVFATPIAIHYGYAEAANFVVSTPTLRNSTLLVSSGSIGEGLLISEVAMREPRPRTVILRATKELAHVDWSGKHYESFFHSPSELLHYLKQAHVTGIVLDTYRGQESFAHQQLVERTISENPQYFQLMSAYKGKVNKEQGQVEIFRVLDTPEKK
jgi:Dolichyl-phosphate-mannose-protein mannosyltransferase